VEKAISISGHSDKFALRCGKKVIPDVFAHHLRFVGFDVMVVGTIVSPGVFMLFAVL